MTRREALLAAVALPAAAKATASGSVGTGTLVTEATTGWMEMTPQGWRVVSSAFMPSHGVVYEVMATPEQFYESWMAQWQAIIAGDDE